MSFIDAIPDFAPALMITPDHAELFRNALFSLPPVSSPSALLPVATPVTVTTADPIDGYSAEATALALLDSGVASDTRDVAFSLFFANAEATPWVPVSPVPMSWSYDLDPNSPVFGEPTGASELVDLTVPADSWLHDDDSCSDHDDGLPPKAFRAEVLTHGRHRAASRKAAARIANSAPAAAARSRPTRPAKPAAPRVAAPPRIVTVTLYDAVVVDNEVPSPPMPPAALPLPSSLMEDRPWAGSRPSLCEPMADFEFKHRPDATWMAPVWPEMPEPLDALVEPPPSPYPVFPQEEVVYDPSLLGSVFPSVPFVSYYFMLPEAELDADNYVPTESRSGKRSHDDCNDDVTESDDDDTELEADVKVARPEFTFPRLLFGGACEPGTYPVTGRTERDADFCQYIPQLGYEILVDCSKVNYCGRLINDVDNRMRHPGADHMALGIEKMRRVAIYAEYQKQAEVIRESWKAHYDMDRLPNNRECSRDLLILFRWFCDNYGIQTTRAKANKH